jgi:calcium permeable stress-gated cation channel
MYYFVTYQQALKVYVPRYESYGRMWPHINNRILASMVLYQVTMYGYFGVQKFVYAQLLIPLPILTVLFGVICSKKFYPSFQHQSLEVAATEVKEVPNMELIYRSFIPPSLSSEKIEDARSEVSRQTSFV